ncbi:AF4/FMR2 family member 1-like [Onychostruthus taczanowskii]|uniref:AF4/FMR2 family member 1-like n=1 Tax=Onychostruthus taczanowskii TaxID=356909 RepID=UPI001B808091|nr:AF4/FMR2 family member 1-like [Onychostruthus taczanowskii]
MEPTDKQNSDNRWKNNRDLLCILEQERRRRQVAPEEKDPFLEKTPFFAKPYKTHKEDELSRCIKNLLGDEDAKVLLSHESPLNPTGIPKKPQSNSQAPSHRPASSRTNPSEDIWRESSPQSLGTTPKPELSYGASNEGLSNGRSEVKAPQSEILPEPVQPMVHTDVQSIEGILKEMSSPLSPLLPSLQSPERTETSKFPVQAKETQ